VVFDVKVINFEIEGKQVCPPAELVQVSIAGRTGLQLYSRLALDGLGLVVDLAFALLLNRVF
jgi:hypothetical protein